MLNYAKDWDQSYTLKSKIKFYLFVKKTRFYNLLNWK